MFDWRRSGGGISGPLDSYYCDGYEVARLSRRVDGAWFASLRLPDGSTRYRDCQTFATGQRGVEAWAERHRDALGAWCSARDAEFRAKNPFAKGLTPD